MADHLLNLGQLARRSAHKTLRGRWLFSWPSSHSKMRSSNVRIPLTAAVFAGVIILAQVAGAVDRNEALEPVEGDSRSSRSFAGPTFKGSTGLRSGNSLLEERILTIDPQFGIPIVVTKARSTVVDAIDASEPTSASLSASSLSSSLSSSSSSSALSSSSSSFASESKSLFDTELLSRSDDVGVVQENVIPPPSVEKIAKPRFLSKEVFQPSVLPVLQVNQTLPNRPWRPYSPKYLGNQLQRRCMFEGRTDSSELFFYVKIQLLLLLLEFG